jgi:FSR family fosmidomycin resistance protein-like MFS transporter
MPLFFALVHFLHHSVSGLVFPLLPFIRKDFALNYTQSGIVSSAYTIPSGLAQLLGGWLADRMGYPLMITIGISGVALGGLLIGLSPNYFMLILMMVLMGVTSGGYHPSASPLIMDLTDESTQGRVLGIHAIGGAASMFVTTLLVAGVTMSIGWRGTFIGVAIPTLILGLVFGRLIRRFSKKKNSEEENESLSTLDRFTTRHWIHLGSFMLMTASIAAVVISLMSFIPLFIVDYFGVSESSAAAYLSILYSAGLWAPVLGGYLSDRIGRMPVILISCFAIAPIIYSLPIVTYGIPLGIVLILMAAFMTMRMPVIEAYIVSKSPPNHRSKLLGVYFLTSMEGGGLLAPLVGRLIDLYGFEFTFTTAGVSILVATLFFAIILWFTKPRNDTNQMTDSLTA